ncbi:glycoside hydrolase [endosymbiont 'TC1' of Trimyema compressum]|uniref:GH25 family lysozyme n=1 Tax=endosymbiont 'TC1' of Trimyema compressum TaxID=243899 RepID=UPI0007F15C5A|nr:GH25 family lysozyme [endosymbiont 'TC1' of Trimyema compressum]AMP20053.1 glycoside hydrolase [endosymbiont 'TC1' of Trimyema compressum]
MNKKRMGIIIGFTLIALAVFLYVFLNGTRWHNEMFSTRYPVQGIDISHYQENIDWEKVSQENIIFVFMKATEGHDYVDPNFKFNWEETGRSGIKRGAYHFFSMRSSGAEQGARIKEIVPYDENSMPPVIDIEIPTNYNELLVKKELQDLILQLKKYYNKEPILYVTYDTYNTYIKNDFQNSPIWIRDILKPPLLYGGRNWTFWQFTDQGKINGIDGYVDKNVYKSTLEQFNDSFSK